MKTGRYLPLLLSILPTQLPAERLAVEAELGMRVDQFDWSIPDLGRGLDVRSELTWRDVRYTTLGVNLRYRPSSRLMLLGRAEYGHAYDGDVQDSDYLGSGRTNEELRSISSAEGSTLLDLSAAIGVPLEYSNHTWTLRAMPLAGLFYGRQRLQITDGRWVIPDAGTIRGLDSRYGADWSGPWLGLEFAAEHAAGAGLRLTLAHYIVDYEADAYWNLRDDPGAGAFCLRRFEQSAAADGSSVTLSGHYRLSDWRLRAMLSWSDWGTDAGTDRAHLCDGTTVRARFNGANRESAGIALGLGYSF